MFGRDNFKRGSTKPALESLERWTVEQPGEGN